MLCEPDTRPAGESAVTGLLGGTVLFPQQTQTRGRLSRSPRAHPVSSAFCTFCFVYTGATGIDCLVLVVRTKMKWHRHIQVVVIVSLSCLEGVQQRDGFKNPYLFYGKKGRNLEDAQDRQHLDS